MKKKFISAFLFGALALAATNTFVSCKDYDDDISANTESINALKTQLTSLQTALDQAKTDAQTAHALYATKTELQDSEAAAKAAAQEAAATAKAEAIAEAVQQCKELIANAGSVSKDDLDALATRIESIEETLNKLPETYATVSYVDAAKQNLQDQINALNYLKEILPEGSTIADKFADIEGLKATLNETIMQVDGQDVTGLKNIMEAINKKVDSMASADVNVLGVLINKTLTSIALVPKYYIDGIEAISFECLSYIPVVEGTSGYQVVSGAKEIKVDAGMAEAVYRLNPSKVSLDDIDTDNIKFVSNKAHKEDPASRAGETDPVVFNGIKSYENGLLTVNAKRNEAVSLDLGNGNIWITSLMVPRKANADKGVEYAEIYSENSMVTETTFSPQIAEGEIVDGEEVLKNQVMYDWQPELGHFYDKETLYESEVDRLDANGKANYDRVYQQVKFDVATDISDWVTICTSRKYTTKADRLESSHNHMTKAELKNYGIKVEFAIASDEYIQAVDNKTNQQEFASITKDGILTSKTPAGVTDNRAVIGKEPIIEISLRDTVRGNLVDQRYVKIKWTDKEITPDEPVQETKTLATYSSTIDFDPCADQFVAEYTWEAFVNNVYAQIGEAGLSQSEFENIYPYKDYKYEGEIWTAFHDLAQTKQAATGAYSGSTPVLANTTNKHGDALIGSWILTVDDINRIIYDNLDPSAAVNNNKVITAKITMPSTNIAYPNLVMEWKVTVNMVKTLPTLVGYYDQYWYNLPSSFDVLPVQYNTDAQQKGNYSGPLYTNTTAGYEHCVYDFNLTNAFTYEELGGQTGYIVKDVPDCGSYDVQFRKAQDVSGYAPGSYTNSLVSTNEPDPESILWNSFPGYQLYKSSNQALQLYWVATNDLYTPAEYTSWVPQRNVRSEKLFANSQNESNWSLLNPLSQDDDISEGYNQKQPKRTHDKKISMGVWARLNGYNYILVKDFDICMIAPLRINQVALDGAFEDGHVSGTSVTFKDIFSMTDFRGYLVSKDAPSTAVKELYTTEQAKYWKELYNYYQVTATDFDLDNVRYTFEKSGSGQYSVVVNNNLSYDKAMSPGDLYYLTNGNLNLSIKKSTDANGNPVLTFKNNGGSNVEQTCYAYIPCTVTYGFGKATTQIKIPVYSHGDKPAN